MKPRRTGSLRRSFPVGLKLLLAASLVATIGRAADIVRGRSSSTSTTSGASGSSSDANTAAAIAKIQTNAKERMAKTSAALQSLSAMQQTARAAAIASGKIVRASVFVPGNSYGVANGLVQASGIAQNAALWQGAMNPVEVKTTQSDGTVASTVTIEQTSQQAVLTWDSFSVGKTTTLVYDQSAGGADVGNWIAFNKVTTTGSPSQILGKIKADGQVYIINPNGILFGNTCEINTHVLVASSLPINDNLVDRGLLNNPDAQFLFSALSIEAGTNGTPAFTPTVADSVSLAEISSNTHVLTLETANNAASPVVSVQVQGATGVTLEAGTDYTVVFGSSGTSTRSTSIVLTEAGLAKAQAAGSALSIVYTPAANQYGNVEVQSGAKLTSPTNADHSGGRIALVGSNVSNAGTITTDDGQAILAAGLQVGFDSHPKTDATLRGLDTYVGAVSIEAASSAAAAAGDATNEKGAVIEAARGSVTIAGATVNQLGAIDSSTSVSYNGRIDLLADYDAQPNAAAYNAINRNDLPPLFAPKSTGVVTLGEESVTQILPEVTSTERVVGTELALPSLINIQGLAIHLASGKNATTGETTGALILAPAADQTTDSSGVTVSQDAAHQLLSSGVTLNAGEWNYFGTATSVYDTFVNDRGQIYLDGGTAIDVSGSRDVAASVSENIVSVQLRGTELADSPLQQDGALRGETVQVDIRKTGTYDGEQWVGTPLADASGYIGLVQRTVGELTTAGGTVSLSAGDSIVLQKGSAINVSGGWINYAGGTVQTTQVASGGHLYDISEATPDRIYDGIVSGTTTTIDPKWGITVTSGTTSTLGSHYEEAYVQGGSGGRISMTAPAMALDGSLAGNTVAGPWQQSSAASLSAKYSEALAPTVVALLAVPQAAELSLTFEGKDPSTRGKTSLAAISPNTPNIVFKNAPASQQAVAAYSFQDDSSAEDYLDELKIAGSRGERGAEIDLSPDLVNSAGFGVLAIDVSGGSVSESPATQGGNVTVPKGTTLAFSPLVSSLTVKAANIDVLGGITAPGGNISLTAYDVSPLVLANSGTSTIPDTDASRGTVTLGGNAVVSAAGLIVEDSPEQEESSPQALAGGSVTLAGFNVTLQDGSQIDVSGGALLNASNKVTYGKGGSLSIAAGNDPGMKNLLGGKLTANLDKVTLSGYAGPGLAGASLSIQAPLIQIGGSSLENGDTLNRTLWLNKTDKSGNLNTDFFSTGGFGSFNLKALGAAKTDDSGEPLDYEFIPAILISGGTADAKTGKILSATKIAPVARSHVLVEDSSVAGGRSFEVSSSIEPEGQRYAVSLSFSSTATRTSDGTLLARGDIVMNEGSQIATDAQTDSSRGVSFSGSTVTILGSVTAPGGTISIAGSSSNSGNDTSNNLFASFDTALPTVVLGSKSKLSTQGKTVLSYNTLGLRTGSVLDGGTISVSGNLVAEKGAILDVSGWSDANDGAGLLYFPKTYSDASISASLTSGTTYVGTLVESDAGTIVLSGGQELYSEATLIGAAGGASANGGTLSISSGRFTAVGDSRLPSDLLLEIAQGSSVLPSTLEETGIDLIGTVIDVEGDSLPERGHIGADSLATKTTKGSDGKTVIVQGGFDNITLGTSGEGSDTGRVQFDGSMTIEAGKRLVIGNGGVISVQVQPQDSLPNVVLSAPYVSLGREYTYPNGTWTSSIAGTSPSYGTGTLTVNATTLIDVGDLSLQNIGKAVLNVPTGDIRGYGTFDLMGNLEMTAEQIYPPTACHFTVVAHDYDGNKGSVSIKSPSPATLPQLPLSAGGTLSIFASTIVQSGVLRAPFGSINLGWDGVFTGENAAIYVDQNTKASVPVTASLTLASGSVTSVSGSDALLGLIPYGINVDGISWIDPVGTDITLEGAPAKVVQISAQSVDVKSGSTIDISGGGDLYAYQWVPGTGGTSDVLLNATDSFAIIPGYSAEYAPLAAYNTSSEAPNLNSDPGYIGSNLKVGQQIYLEASAGLEAGYYTLLPARYALLPGAYLVTSRTSIPNGKSASLIDGSSVVSGYLVDGLSGSSSGARPLYQSFTVELGTPAASSQESETVEKGVRARSEYVDYSAAKFLSEAAVEADLQTVRGPSDAGQLILEASAKMAIQGAIVAQASGDGAGGLVDISSPVDILVGSSSTASSGDYLVLDAAELSAYDAESLLIGGVRKSTTQGLTASASVDNIVVDNAGTPLQGRDVILLAKQNITLKDGASIGDGGKNEIASETVTIDNSYALQKVGDAMTFARGGTSISVPKGTGNAKLTATSAGTITASDGTQTRFLASDSSAGKSNPFTVSAGSVITLDEGGTLRYASTSDTTASPVALEMGDGAVLRVSSDPDVQISRASVASLATPSISAGPGARISAAGALIDSTYITTLNPSIDLTGTKSLSLGSSRISVQLAGAGALRDVPDSLGNGLVLTSGALQSLTQSVDSLALKTYASLDLYGTGAIGSSSFSQLTVHTPEINGDGGSVSFVAKNILLDNSTGATASDSSALGAETAASGTLLFKADTIGLGANTLNVERYRSLELEASSAILLENSGTLATQGALTLTTPQVAAAQDATGTSSTISGTISAEGDLRIVSGGAPSAASSGSLGASLELEGASVFLDTAVWLPSGSLSLRATGESGDVTLGSSAFLHLEGSSKQFNDVTTYTDGGSASFRSEHGDVVLQSGALVDLSAEKDGGGAGSLNVSAPEGSFLVASKTAVDGKGVTRPTLDASNGEGGSFTGDISGLGDPSGSGTTLDDLETLLALGNFTGAQSVRVRAGDLFLNSTITARDVSLTADAGSVVIQGDGLIDASGSTGGDINLSAGKSVVLNSGAVLTVKGDDFDSAGKGGSVSLEAGSSTNGETPSASDTRDPSTGRFLSDATPVVDIQQGSKIDLSVASSTADSAAEGKYSGTLHLRAPQTYIGAGQTAPDVQIDPIAGDIVSASSIVVEGYKTYDPIAGAIESVEAQIDADGRLFASGANTEAILSSLTLGNAKLGADKALFHVRPGAEIVGSLSNSGVSDISLALSRSGANGDKLTIAAGGSVYLPSGTASASNKLTIDSSAETSIQATQGGTLTFPNDGTVTVKTLRGCTVTKSGSSVSTTVPAGSTITVGKGDVIKLNSTVDLVTVSSTAAFELSSTGPTTIGLSKTNSSAGSLAFSAGSGTIQTIIEATSYSNTGSGTPSTIVQTGNLTLSNNWDLSTFRYGSDADPTRIGSGEPGILTLRAAGNLVFSYDSTKSTGASLSDGFDVSAQGTSALAVTSSEAFWKASLLYAGAQSWEYRLVAGSDLASADYRSVMPLSGSGSVADGSGSVLLGKGAGAIPTLTTTTTTRSSIIPKYYQTIRTGTGDISIYAGRDVEILNQIATVYTAGTQAESIDGFDVPVTNAKAATGSTPAFQTPAYPAQFSLAGGDVTIVAQNDIGHFLQTSTGLTADSTREMPTNWLYRRGSLDASGAFDETTAKDIASTSWWVDFSNFFEGVGALGGGNVTLKAGRDVSNVDAVVPTNMRVTGKDASGAPILPSDATAYELGGGDLQILAGRNIDGGVYYVEKGEGSLVAGGEIKTNATRAALTETTLKKLKNPDSTTWLPTTLFLGKGSFEVSATGDVLLGSTANPFLLPQGTDNSYYYKSYFSTYSPESSVDVFSTVGDVTLANSAINSGASLWTWYTNVLGKPTGEATYSYSQPWLNLIETSMSYFQPLMALMPPSLRMTAYSGDINLVGNVTLVPSETGSLDILAAGAINGFSLNSRVTNISGSSSTTTYNWTSSLINVSDADPDSLPGVFSPVGLSTYLTGLQQSTRSEVIRAIAKAFTESGATGGSNIVLQTQQMLHGSSVDEEGNSQALHADDDEPVRLYALSAEEGDISGITLYSPKEAKIAAGRDITDVSFYIQNTSSDDISVVSAGRNLHTFDANSSLRLAAIAGGAKANTESALTPGTATPNAGDIQISGPGTLEVLAGGNIDLGRPSREQTYSLASGLSTGITSIGNTRNPLLPFEGADVLVAAGIGAPQGFGGSSLSFATLIQLFLNPSTAGANASRYLPELGSLLGMVAGTSIQEIWQSFQRMPEDTTEHQDAKNRLLLDIFYSILRDTGRDRNDPDATGYGTYEAGMAAIQALFGDGERKGNISMSSREIATQNGGDISILAPGGSITVGLSSDKQTPEQGILTAHGGDISIFAKDNVSIGTSRIFTLRGGDEIIWSTEGNIAAGSGSKTVHSAPPTRVLINPQSGNVINDLAGLATGSGIGVLATLEGVEPGDVDLIAPSGTIDAGDAGIRSSGNLNLAAQVVLNAANIQAGGSVAGAPPAPSVPNLGSLAAASSASAASSGVSSEMAKQTEQAPAPALDLPSIFVVEVLGYGGSGGDDEKDDAATP